MRRVSAVIGWVLALLACEAQGQDLKAVQACTRVGDDASRLACYDAALGVVKPSAAKPSIAQPSVAQPPVAKPPSPGKTDAQAKFGDNGALHPVPKADLLKTLTAQVQQAAPLPNGLYRLTLDNGQVWHTTESDMALAFKANDKVVISRGVLGSYHIALAGHATSVSVKRVQ
jgi:hypothetical protein